jgi:signal transduction histidine kinase
MQLRLRAIVTSLIVALPAAAILAYGIDSLRTRDRTLTLERVVNSQINDQVRERCESDPTWFLTGPLTGRPPHGQPPSPSPDVETPPGPRPRVEEQPFELFAFDEDFVGSSPATPRMPNDLRKALRQSRTPVIAPFDTKEGTGVQMAVWTGWIGSPCAIFLGRLRPLPHQFAWRAAVFAGLAAVCFLVALVTVAPTVRRVRRLAREARASARSDYASIAPDRKRDEASSITFTFNEAASTIHLRETEIKDREEALSRLLADLRSGVLEPAVAVEERLAALARAAGVPDDLRDVQRQAARDAHDAAVRLGNLVSAVRLRSSLDVPGRVLLDLGDLVERVAGRFTPFARAGDVSLAVSVPPGEVTITAEPALLEQAIGNIVDNAIRYNRPGGHVTMDLHPVDVDGRIVLRIVDDGPGVPDQVFTGLTAIRRFRGDEGRTRTPEAPGLGLAVAREVAERMGLTMTLRQPAGGGFEVEFAGRATGEDGRGAAPLPSPPA